MARTTRWSEDLLTLQDFLDLPEEDEYRLELVGGLLVREPRPAPPHARVVTKLVFALEQYVRERGGGVVLTDAGFVLSEHPATVRIPDLAFVSESRIPAETDRDGFWHFAPDLAVEVLSPSNSASEMSQKIMEYFAGGARLVWVADPRLRSVTVHDASSAHVLVGDAVLEGANVLPGFRLELSSLFALWPGQPS